MERRSQESDPRTDHQKGSNCDEIFMQHTLLFADSLKDLRGLRKQLYSAADYFELSYHKDDHNKELLVENLKDYLDGAVVSAVDHLGSVAYKLDNILNEKAAQISAATVRFSSIQQRSRTSQEFIAQYCGLSQQSLAIETPKHHKRYIIPGDCSSVKTSTQKAINAEPYTQFPGRKKEAATTRLDDNSWSGFGTFSFAKNASLKRSASPLAFSLRRSGSAVSRSTPTPTTRNNKYQCTSEPRRSISMCIKPSRNDKKEIQLYSKKHNQFLKALLSIHRSR